MRPYLRNKYGHLSSDARRQVEDLLGELEAEQSAKRAAKKAVKRTGGGRS